jgi:3-deoxy-manno-octulosonate cytidylyltransferase (CMP-KDO synthetase)
MNDKNNLVYASRLPIPGYKDEMNKIKIKYYKQVCIYAFNKSHLNKFLNYKKKSTLETFEDIEILRFLELNTKIKMIKINNQNLAVDVKEDIIKVENFILKKS